MSTSTAERATGQIGRSSSAPPSVQDHPPGPSWACPRAVVAVLATAKAAGALTDTVANIHQWSLRQAVTPDDLAGRVTAGHRFIVYGVGALLGGVLGGAVGLRRALLLCAAGSLLAPLVAVFSPLRRLHDQPDAAVTPAVRQR